MRQFFFVIALMIMVGGCAGTPGPLDLPEPVDIETKTVGLVEAHLLIDVAVDWQIETRRPDELLCISPDPDGAWLRLIHEPQPTNSLPDTLRGLLRLVAPAATISESEALRIAQWQGMYATSRDIDQSNYLAVGFNQTYGLTAGLAHWRSTEDAAVITTMLQSIRPVK